MNDEEIKQENKTEPLDEDNLDQGIHSVFFISNSL